MRMEFLGRKIADSMIAAFFWCLKDLIPFLCMRVYVGWDLSRLKLVK
jgi:hypothetical protein